MCVCVGVGGGVGGGACVVSRCGGGVEARWGGGCELLRAGLCLRSVGPQGVLACLGRGGPQTHTPHTRAHTHTHKRTHNPRPRRAPVTGLNLGGYSIAFGAVCWYNYTKLQSMKQAQASPQKVISISANAKVRPGGALLAAAVPLGCSNWQLPPWWCSA